MPLNEDPGASPVASARCVTYEIPVRFVDVTLRALPVCHEPIELICQPPTTWSAALLMLPSSLFPLPNRSSYTTLVTKRWRISKSDTPLSSWKFAGFRLGEPNEPAESLSIDFAYVS